MWSICFLPYSNNFISPSAEQRQVRGVITEVITEVTIKHAVGTKLNLNVSLYDRFMTCGWEKMPALSARFCFLKH